jgi:hypothetical protein
MPQGEGTYVHSDGIRFDGVFRDGLPWRGEEIGSDGKYIRRYAFGKSIE